MRAAGAIGGTLSEHRLCGETSDQASCSRSNRMNASAAATQRSISATLHPPGPRGLPIIGCLLPFLRSPMEAMARAARVHGGIARIPIRGKYLYLVSDPELVRELLVTHREKFVKNTRYRHMQALVGQGLLLSEADAWRRQRLITQQAFRPDEVAAQIGWMAGLTDRFLDRWEKTAGSSSVIDVEPEFSRLAQLLSGRFLMGEAFDEVAARFCEASCAIKQHWPQSPRGLWSMLLSRPMKHLVQFDAAVADLDACIYRFLTKQRKSDFERCGLLERLVRTSRAEHNEFTDRELRDQLFTLFFAGHETSATGLCWIHYLLWRHAAVREQLQREVDRVVGSRMPAADDLPNLQYTEQVVQESLRLYSPIHSISRVALMDSIVGGYHIPAGATVCVSMYATHRLPKYWPDPERFDPLRFTPEQCAARPRFAYIPFAAGHRNCIGSGQALAELKLVVARIAQRYRLDLAANQRIEPAPGTTMYPRYGMRMTLRHRPALP